MEHIAVAIDRLQQPVDTVLNRSVRTGLPTLERMTGPLRRGQLWAITGWPASGKTTLAMQWATTLANAVQPTMVLAPCDAPEQLAEQAVAFLSHVLRDRLDRADGPDAERVRKAQEHLAHIDLHIERPAHPSDRTLPGRFTLSVAAVVIDDIDLFGDLDATLTLLRSWCDERGYFVLITCPLEKCTEVVGGRRRLGLRWNRLVDVTLELTESASLADGGLGYPDRLDVISNRHGPLGDLPVLWKPYYGCFTEVDG